VTPYAALASRASVHFRSTAQIQTASGSCLWYDITHTHPAARRRVHTLLPVLPHALGFEPTFGDADSGYADFDTGSVTLALFDADEIAGALDDPPGGARGRDDACVVFRVDDVEETAANLRDQGITLAAPPTDHPEWGVRTVHARDPDGTLLEFNEPFEGRPAIGFSAGGPDCP